jgi:DNA-binding protein H-NS
MAAVNVERMTLKQIEVLEVQIAKAKADARETAKAELKAKIDRLLDGSDFTIAELYGLKGKKGRAGKSSAKYANPDDPSQTYTGRGRRPFWLTAKLKKGASLEDFAI